MLEATTETEQEWFADWFSREEYELVYRNRDKDDALRLLNLFERVVQPEKGARILDLACGRGRHAVNLAHRGYEVTGVDLGEPIIKQARLRAVRENVNVRFVQGDMREPVENGVFDGVLNLFTSFGYFEDDADHQRVIEVVSRMLPSQGWFFQDFLNAEYVRNTLIPDDERVEGDTIIKQHRWIESGRINKTITLQRSDDIHTFTESVRLLTIEDFSRWYRNAGLEIIDVYGSYNGDPLSDKSPRLILYSRKR